MADLTDDAEIEAALERGRIAQPTEPRAASARYDRPMKRRKRNHDAHPDCRP